MDLPQALAPLQLLRLTVAATKSQDVAVEAISTWGLRSEQWLLLLGKSWENHGKTIGKP